MELGKDDVGNMLIDGKTVYLLDNIGIYAKVNEIANIVWLQKLIGELNDDEYVKCTMGLPIYSKADLIKARDDMFVLNQVYLIAEEESRDNCIRAYEDIDDGWTCINDHTGCLYNDGHNGCNHEGWSIKPLNGGE